MELTEGNLHSTLEYHSDDEIGKLAHSMRKSIRILGTYVDDIDRSMKLFSEGNFDVHPEVEWRGDFVGILNSFMAFQASMAGTIKGIQNVSNEVSGAAEQVDVYKRQPLCHTAEVRNRQLPMRSYFLILCYLAS